jgi:serine phosphatase RsbU (regulator of sigma subunit)/anti-sigma regulatory factor (Ser/Thr protein kinase)
MEEYFSLLEIPHELFSSFNEFIVWRGDNEEAVIDFVFIGVSIDDDSNFRESVRLKELLKKNSLASFVFLLKEHHDSHYIKSLKYGDGYLLKPFSSDLLVSTMHYHSKHSKLNDMLARKNEKLIEYQNLVKTEHDIVETIFSKHCEQHLVSSEDIKFYISPASIFNGDVLLTARGPSGSLYLAVGDVTGHGLPAAIGAMPAYSTFRAMAKKGKNIGSIVAEMNHALRMLLPNNMMMALIVVELDFASGKMFIWSGGMPDIIIVDEQGAIVQKVVSRHAPLTVLGPDKFRKDVDIINLQEGDRIYFYTDGIEEARNENGEMFGVERFQKLFSGDTDKIFNNVIEANAKYLENSEQDDDITLVEVLYRDQVDAISVFTEEVEPDVLSIPWEMNFTLSAKELKETDPIAQVINFIDSAVDVKVHQDCISTILSELYSNSVDHGLLKLDSSIKDTEEGFVDYYIARKKELDNLSDGQVKISLAYKINPDSELGQLTITIHDSGDGFDYESLAQSNIDMESTHSYGRGIGLLTNLCSHFIYQDGGRTAIAHYDVNRKTPRVYP